jgi:hypothetical protein
MSFRPFKLLLVFLLTIPTHCMHNISIDDTDPSITYQGIWTPDFENASSLYYGGTLAASTDPNANATLMFTGTHDRGVFVCFNFIKSFPGVAVYYLSSLWTFPVSVDISIDFEDSVSVNLTVPNDSTEPSSQPMWEATGLTNGTHEVVISMSEGSTSMVVDGFM